MKRLLYLAFKDFSNLHFGGNTKVLSQCRAFAQYGWDVDLIGRQGSNIVRFRTDGSVAPVAAERSKIRSQRLKNLLARQNQFRAIRAYLKNRTYDACYIRYDFSDAGFIRLLQSIRKVCPKIALELPTYPYEKENKSGLLSRCRLLQDQLFRRQLHRYIDFIVTFYAGYETLFGIPVLVIPNGFDFSSMELVKAKLQPEEIHIIAVSSMREWHGYERFLEGMHRYYQDGRAAHRSLILHLVGNGREYGKYKALIDSFGLNHHVILEGALHGKALDDLYEICSLGIDSLARHRSGISVLSSLKSREYAAKGLPMINSCRIDIFDDDFPYLLRVSADEKPVSMYEVLEFYDRCYHSGKNRQEIGREIRTCAEARSGMKQTLAAVADRFAAR